MKLIKSAQFTPFKILWVHTWCSWTLSLLPLSQYHFRGNPRPVLYLVIIIDFQSPSTCWQRILAVGAWKKSLLTHFKRFPSNTNSCCLLAQLQWYLGSNYQNVTLTDNWTRTLHFILPLISVFVSSSKIFDLLGQNAASCRVEWNLEHCFFASSITDVFLFVCFFKTQKVNKNQHATENQPFFIFICFWFCRGRSCLLLDGT